MDNKICLSCRFGSVQIEVLVPETCDLEKFVTETRNFASDVIAVTKEKPIHYSFTLASEQGSPELVFKVHCTCILNVNKNDCSKFNLTENNDCKVKHLSYSKSEIQKEIEIKI